MPNRIHLTIMPGIKLNIGGNKTKQVAHDSKTATTRGTSNVRMNLVLSCKKSMFRSHQDIKTCKETSAIIATSKPPNANTSDLVTGYKKPMLKSHQDNTSYVQASRSRVINSSFNTADGTETSSVLTTDEIMFDTWGIESSTNIDDMRRSFTISNQSTSRTSRSIIEFKEPNGHQPKSRNSWVSSSFNADVDNSDDELDDSVYTLLDDQDECHFRKLSLHDILVEEELSFRKSLVWNDEDK